MHANPYAGKLFSLELNIIQPCDGTHWHGTPEVTKDRKPRMDGRKS